MSATVEVVLELDSYGTRRAISELASIFACQWSNGMLPQIRFMEGQHGYRPDADDWGVTPGISGLTRLRTSGITQPPIVGLCLYEVFRKITEQERVLHYEDFTGMSEGLERYHRWLLTERDPWGERLAVCLHPWETGTDNSPAFDPLVEKTRVYIEAHDLPVQTFGRADTLHVKGEHRPTARDYFSYFGLLALFKEHDYNQPTIIDATPFLLQDVLFNALLVVSLRSLASLQAELAVIGRAIGGRVGASEKLKERAARNLVRAEEVAEAIRGKLWEEEDGFFYSYDSRGECLLRTRTVSGLVPLMGEIALPAQAERLEDYLRNPGEFWTEVPVPSTSLSSPAFDPLRYWSGPSWPVTNWLVVRGLRERGSSLAGELRQSTLKMISQGADAERTWRAAVGVMEQNSVGEEFTTPSTRQYEHGWLWDSAIVSASWPLVSARPAPYKPREGDPGFWEYYQPHTGEPLGAANMSWTASLFLEMESMDL